MSIGTVTLALKHLTVNQVVGHIIQRNYVQAIKSYDANSNAYTGLLLTISPKTDAGKVAFSIVENAVSTDFPDGDAKAAFDRLEAR